MEFKTNKATAIIFKTPKSKLHEEMISFSKEKGLKNVVILDELKVNDPNDFGKGYGKEILTKLFDTFDNIVACPSYVYYEETEIAYSGRNEMNIDFLEKNTYILFEEFYIPQALKQGRIVSIEKSSGGQTLILMTKEKK